MHAAYKLYAERRKRYAAAAAFKAVCRLSSRYRTPFSSVTGGFVSVIVTSCCKSTILCLYTLSTSSFNIMFVHRELIALVIVAFSATNKITASSTSRRHLRGPGTEFEDLLAVFFEEDEEERHLSALPPPEGSTYAPTPTPEPAECNQPCSDDEVCARESPNAKAKCHTSALKIHLTTPVQATTCASLLCLTVKDMLMYSISSVSASNLKARICACILTAD
mmetsp:Transcript_31808/g.46791  ORF Transcript_31808/g.46791 Transcript_31808/m.46791 type:complete len:221 (+) Transcript_31808:2-664(+)